MPLRPMSSTRTPCGRPRTSSGMRPANLFLRSTFTSNRAAPPHGRAGRGEADAEVGPRGADRQAVSVAGPALAARVAHAHQVIAVGGRVEEQARVAAVAGAAVVVAVVERDHREAVGRER